MRTSKYKLYTLKEAPSHSEIISHKLMLRAGMIRKLSSGLYTWLPSGLRVLNKIKNIIRREINKIDFLEVSIPIVQPANIWRESGRLKQYGPELLRFTDRNTKLFVLGPTHEEAMTYLVRNEIHSYKELPLNLYQIQTKFRDEIRPRFGIMRSREFIMKDAYSFHINQESLHKTYNLMYDTYINIFRYIGLKICVVQADSGSIGGNISHEFHALANIGEDNIVFSTKSNYAANIELANSIRPTMVSPIQAKEKIRLVNTPAICCINDLVNQLNIPLNKIIKILIVKATSDTHHNMIALVLRADHELNKKKAEKLSQILVPLTFITKKDIFVMFNIEYESLGPINLPIPMIIDHSVSIMSDFIAGANIKGKHYFGINWNRDLPLPEIADLRMVINGDPSPDGKGILQIKRGIEVGHIFQLGDKYSQLMQATVQNKNGQRKTLQMGCYGIGITRSLAAVVEQNYDNQGIIWPDTLAPFQIALIPINMYASHRVANITEQIYQQLKLYNIDDILLDDRNTHYGVMLADIELIGIPHIVIISEHNLNNNTIEYKNRNNSKKHIIQLDKILDFLIKKMHS